MTKLHVDPNQMMTTHQAAALLGLQACTLAAWREDGSHPGLTFFKLGKAVRYRYGDIQAFLETRRASSTLAARELPVLTMEAPTVRDGRPTRPRPARPRAAPKQSAKPAPREQQSLF